MYEPEAYSLKMTQKIEVIISCNLKGLINLQWT